MSEIAKFVNRGAATITPAVAEMFCAICRSGNWPYVAVAQAVFTLIYAHKKIGIIPDSILDLGGADNSSLVRAVLIQNETAFAIYAGKQGVDWRKITSKA